MTICDQFPSASCLAANAGQEQEKTQEQQRVRRARLRWTLQITAAGVVDGPATTSLKKAAVHEVLARSSQALPPTGGVASREAGRDWEQQRVSPARLCSSNFQYFSTYLSLFSIAPECSVS